MKVYIDGGAIKNPGKAAIAFLIYDDNKNLIKKYKKFIGIKTNNEAEYTALIEALGHLKKYKNENIEILTDSKLLWGHLTNKFQIRQKSLFPYFIKAHNKLIKFSNLKIKLIPREKNKIADKMVKDMLSSIIY